MSWVLVTLLVAAGGGALGRPAPLLVSAAVSLTEALTECARSFERTTGHQVSLNFGASNALARQIVNGAPVDVFVSADEAQMAFVAQRGGLLPGTRRPIAGNALAIVTTGDDVQRWRDPSTLASREVRRVAMGDPRAVPAGVYAKQWLERIGLWRAVESKVIPSGSVRAALAAVAGGAVDTAIVYRTDVRAVRGVSIVYEVTGEHAQAIVYPAAVTSQARDVELARRFIEFLRSAEGQKILVSHGFLPLAS